MAQPLVFFPRTLTRKQYLIRCLIVFVIVAAALVFFVGAPSDLVRLAGILLQIVVLLAFLYNIFWLSIPRLRNAQLTFLWIVLVFVPFGALVLFAICVYSASAEEKSLKLVEDFHSELIHALDSLGGKTVSGVLDTYRFWSSKHLQRAVDGFAFLRRSGRLDGSKFLVRPAIEMAFRLEAARQYPDLFYRIARSEHLQDKHLVRIAGDDRKLQAQSDKTWDVFDNAFKKEFSKVTTIPNADDRPSIEYLADKAKLKPFYDSHYRIYSRYTHGAVHASTGNIDEATDRANNRTWPSVL